MRSVASHTDPLSLQVRRRALEVVHMELERARIGFWAQGHLRNLGGPPEGELATFRFDHGPNRAPFSDHPEPQQIAIEREGLVHVIHGEEDVTYVLDDSHGTAMVVRGYMKPRCKGVSMAVRRNLNRPGVPSRQSHASRRRADGGVLRFGDCRAPRL